MKLNILIQEFELTLGMGMSINFICVLRPYVVNAKFNLYLDDVFRCLLELLVWLK